MPNSARRESLIYNKGKHQDIFEMSTQHWGANGTRSLRGRPFFSPNQRAFHGTELHLTCWLIFQFSCPYIRGSVSGTLQRTRLCFQQKLFYWYLNIAVFQRWMRLIGAPLVCNWSFSSVAAKTQWIQVDSSELDIHSLKQIISTSKRRKWWWSWGIVLAPGDVCLFTTF